MVIFLQDTPPGIPRLVEPKMDKVDIPHLKKDIAKFNEAGVFRDEDNKWWELFLDSFMVKYGQVPD